MSDTKPTNPTQMTRREYKRVAQTWAEELAREQGQEFWDIPIMERIKVYQEAVDSHGGEPPGIIEPWVEEAVRNSIEEARRRTEREELIINWACVVFVSDMAIYLIYLLAKEIGLI